MTFSADGHYAYLQTLPTTMDHGTIATQTYDLTTFTPGSTLIKTVDIDTYTGAAV